MWVCGKCYGKSGPGPVLSVFLVEGVEADLSGNEKAPTGDGWGLKILIIYFGCVLNPHTLIYPYSLSVKNQGSPGLGICRFGKC